MKLREQGLEIEFKDAVDALIFDQMDSNQPNYHGIGQMHRVDFIVEFEEAIVFVEIKDPENPNAQKIGLEKFRTKLLNGTLSTSFAAKFVDSFLYRWAEEKIHKPVHYLNLVTLDGELLPNLSDEIARKLPPWERLFHAGNVNYLRTVKFLTLTPGTRIFQSGRCRASQQTKSPEKSRNRWKQSNSRDSPSLLAAA